jgi:hypothetical protein
MSMWSAPVLMTGPGELDLRHRGRAWTNAKPRQVRCWNFPTDDCRREPSLEVGRAAIAGMGDLVYPGRGDSLGQQRLKKRGQVQ